MPVALDCRYRPGGAEERFAIRDVHLIYMIANRQLVLAGGASTNGDAVIGMYLLLATDELAGADAFLAEEPYTKAGLFAEIRRTAVTLFIPEPREGFLLGLLEKAEPVAKRLRDRTCGSSS